MVIYLGQAFWACFLDRAREKSESRPVLMTYGTSAPHSVFKIILKSENQKFHLTFMAG